MLYIVSYSVEGMPSQVSFYYEEGKQKSIWLKNQEKTIWTKVSAT